MNDIQIFNNEDFGEVRALTIDNEPWFVGKDIATILGYVKPENAVSAHVDTEDKTTTLIQGTGCNYKSKTVIINESGLYSLILSSKLPSAKRFKHWVTSEVLPAIRKTGGYGTNTPTEDDSKQRRLAVQETNARNKSAQLLLQAIRYAPDECKADIAMRAAEIVLNEPIKPKREYHKRKLINANPDTVEAIRAYLADKTEICIIELWQNALGHGSASAPTRKDSNSIAETLTNHFPDWGRAEAPKRLPVYGMQKYWTRRNEEVTA